MSERLSLQAVELTYQDRVVELNVNGETYVTPYQSSLYGPGLEVNKELHAKINAALNSASRHAERDELLTKRDRDLLIYLKSYFAFDQPKTSEHIGDLLARFAALEKETGNV